jgi:hypothetical protein
MNNKIQKPPQSQPPSARADIEAFLQQVRTAAPVNATGRGRLMFALDATQSRQPTWDLACQLQGEMFEQVAAIGGLQVQLVYYRSLSECKASDWVPEPRRLAKIMSGIHCRSGATQIGKVLSHTLRESANASVGTLVFVGDAMEEKLDTLSGLAGQLGQRNVRAFMFQEGDDPVAERAFRDIARLTHGAYCRFAPGAADELRELLRAAAAYAAGGMQAIEYLKGRHGGVVKLIEQLK